MGESLLPWIDRIPSVFSPLKLAALIKLRRTNPEWSLSKVANYLKLPEYRALADEEREQQEKELHEQTKTERLHQQATIELIQREQPSIARDFFGATPLVYFTERHPELAANLVAGIDSLQQTGKDIREALETITKYESPIHVAIRLSQEGVLQLLLEKGVNTKVPCGHAYPIHLAMKHESKGCTELLLKHDNQCLTHLDKKYNGSALHWAKNTEQIDLLASQENINLDHRNVDGETPLHIMVARKRLSPCISLICHGADINARDDRGETPLHKAVMQDDLDIVRCLLLLGSDFTLLDNRGQTPMQNAEANYDYYSDIKDLFSLFQMDAYKLQADTSTSPRKQQQQTSSFPRHQSVLKERTGNEAVLCLDGGGIRGLILAEVLLALECVTGFSTYDLFDWSSGTSTGSYLAMSMANGKSVRYVQHSYLRLGRSCFIGIRPYPTELVDSFLLNEFGETTKMNEITFPKIMIPAVLADRRPAMLHMFRNYDAPYDDHYQMRDARFPRPPYPSDQLVWLATRSSCSAPSYFRSTGRYLDGGLIANNPTLDALSEIHKHQRYNGNNGNKVKLIVSIGTGRQPLQPLRPIDLYRPSSVWETAEIVDNLKGFVDLMVDQVSASDDHVVDRARSWCEMAGLHYFRFNPVLSTNVEMNETDDRLILGMMCDVRKFILKRMTEFTKMARLLLGDEEEETS